MNNLLVQLGDRFVNWLNAGYNKIVMMAIFVICLLLTPYWTLLFLFFVFGIEVPRYTTPSILIWVPAGAGMLACLFLPIENFSGRVAVGFLHMLVSLIILCANFCQIT